MLKEGQSINLQRMNSVVLLLTPTLLKKIRHVYVNTKGVTHNLRKEKYIIYKKIVHLLVVEKTPLLIEIYTNG